jgi:translocation protein SEC63
MKVEDPPEDETYSDDEDISDPEEDTLAGQMAMMRGGKVKPSGVHGKSRGDDDSGEGEDGSEYESSSDEEGPVKAKPTKRKVGGRVRAINEDSSDSD